MARMGLERALNSPSTIALLSAMSLPHPSNLHRSPCKLCLSPHKVCVAYFKRSISSDFIKVQDWWLKNTSTVGRLDIGRNDRSGNDWKSWRIKWTFDPNKPWLEPRYRLSKQNNCCQMLVPVIKIPCRKIDIANSRSRRFGKRQAWGSTSMTCWGKRCN